MRKGQNKSIPYRLNILGIDGGVDDEEYNC